MKLLAVCMGTAQPIPGHISTKTGIFKQPVGGAKGAMSLRADPLLAESFLQ